jgi:CDP-diacylglycerol--serine O-phosphatidyltransferase
MLKLLSVADVVSLLNAIFGFISIVMIYLGELRLGFSFILLALLADGLDGIVARKRGKGKLGEYFEAMADMISMGVAPAFFVFTIYYETVSYCVYYTSYLVIALIVFLSFGIIRLASFHIIKQKEYFVGLPASASTIILLVLAYLSIDFWLILLVIVVVSLAMISNVHFPKLGYRIDVVAVVLIFLTLIMDKSYSSIAPILLLLAIVFYAFGGPIYLLKNR